MHISFTAICSLNIKENLNTLNVKSWFRKDCRMRGVHWWAGLIVLLLIQLR